MAHNMFTIQDHNSILCGFYCVAFIEYMVAEKNLLDYTYFLLLAIKRTIR